jgi:hypothetical protein
MASKINQITMGDSLIIQLDNNPRTTGYSAPLGSLAYWDNGTIGRLYVKIGNSNNAWNDLHYSWQYQGNNLGTVSYGILGSIAGVNKDIQFIRNGIEYSRAIENTETNQKDVTMSFFENNIVMVDVDVNSGYDFFGKSIVLHQGYTTETALESDRYNFTIKSRGQLRRTSDLGYVDECHEYDSLASIDVYVKSASRGKALKNKTPTLGKLSMTAFNLNTVNPELFTIEVNAIIKRISDNKIVDLKRKFNVDCTNFSTQTFTTLDRQDISSFFQFGSTTVDMELRFENTSDLYVPEVGNTLNVVLDFIGLDNLENYTIIEWTEITLLER